MVNVSDEDKHSFCDEMSKFERRAAMGEDEVRICSILVAATNSDRRNSLWLQAVWGWQARFAIAVLGKLHDTIAPRLKVVSVSFPRL